METLEIHRDAAKRATGAKAHGITGVVAVTRWLSPGGSADLLAAALLVSALETGAAIYLTKQ
jgi:hypothetical protein